MSDFHPWALSAAEVLRHLNTSSSGLTDAEAAIRFQTSGPNIIDSRRPRGPIQILLSQFASWLVITLIFASIVSFFLGDQLDTLIILGIIFLSVVFGFIQEYKAEQIVNKLKALVTHKAVVLRNQIWREIDSSLLVSGDIVKLHIGDQVPADLRLISTDNFQVNESLLTGESQIITKSSSAIGSDSAQVYQQANMAFAGSFVASGIATGAVVATGINTQFGQTTQQLTETELASDFQKQIGAFSQFLVKVVFLLTIFVFGSNALLHKGLFESFLFAVALAVGITPELLPVIITVTLSRGAMKMAKHKVIVKKLVAVEDFGNIDTLCCDKTGTLTEGTMSLVNFENLRGEKSLPVLSLALLCSSGYSTAGQISTNPIDQAIWTYFHSSNHQGLLADYEITDENEFDFERRVMSVVVKAQNKFTLIVKGAPDSVLFKCSHHLSGTRPRLLSPQVLSQFQQQFQKYESDGYRVLAVATKTIKRAETSAANETGLTLVGWLLFSDPVKASAAQTLQLFQKLGVRIKIMSGDAPEVVFHTARSVGLEIKNHEIITGADFDSFTDDQLAEVAANNSYFARINPQQKYRLVSALNKEGHIVGFLGDGINDAPALKAADVGIAVDSGAGIAKAAADIILLKKDLHTLAQGILLGRSTFGNITKYILNTISANYGNMFTVAVSSLFLPFIPQLPKQILLNNFISDVPLLTIATDNVDHSYTARPRRWDMKFISRFMIFFGFISSLFDFLTILPLIFIWKVSPEVFRTAWFIESALSEMIITFSVRTQLPFFKSRPSPLLVISSLISSLVVLAFTFFAFTQKLFEFSLLPLSIYIWIAVELIIYFMTTEIVKHYFFKKYSSLASSTEQTLRNG